MNNGKILAGLDAGHVNTKAVVMRGKEIIGYSTVPTGFDVASASKEALNGALHVSGILLSELGGIVATGIFRDIIKGPSLNVIETVPEYVADAKGAFFLNKNSRTVIDIGGNIHKAIHYDRDGNILDVIQNDKCADGLGIFYTTMAKALGVNEGELSELALKTTRHVSIAIHCAVSAESEAIDLLCQGMDMTDVADGVVRFMVERVAAMCRVMPLTEEIVVAGGLARSKAIVKGLSGLLKKDISVLNPPEYTGAIGAVMSYGGER